MTRMLFFELIQVALGNREELSRVPTAKEWSDLYEESGRQAITGVMVAGLEKLKANTNGTNYTNKLPLELLLQWIGASEQIRLRNVTLTKRCVQLQRKLKELGHESSILKGQGVAMLYDRDKEDGLGMLRQSGDIDIFVDGGFERALKFAHDCGQKDVNWDYKHLHLKVFPDTEVEVHYRVEVLMNLWKNRKLQKWFEEQTEEIFGHTDLADLTDSDIGRYAQNINKNDIKNSTGTTDITDNTENDSTTNFTNDTNNCSAEIKEKAEMVTPTVEFNVFYILLHIYRHFLYEGVGMRQIMDYYFVLRMVQEFKGLRVKDYVDAVDEFGMTKFAKGLMWVMQKALGMPREWMLWEPDAKEGQYILDEVMAGGNFGHHDQRLKHGGGKWNTVKQVCRHNWHLMSHYPSDVIWAPVWFVWHKCWKMAHRVCQGTGSDTAGIPITKKQVFVMR